MLSDHTGIRSMRNEDVGKLQVLDFKHSEFPWVEQDWRAVECYFMHWDIIVGTVLSEPRAFTVFEAMTNGVGHIHRFVSDELAAEKGLDLALLEALRTEACSRKCRVLQVTVPETSCKGADDPYDLSCWLSRAGFTCEETLNNAFEAYGQKFDCYIFRKPVLKG